MNANAALVIRGKSDVWCALTKTRNGEFIEAEIKEDQINTAIKACLIARAEIEE